MGGGGGLRSSVLTWQTTTHTSEQASSPTAMHQHGTEEDTAGFFRGWLSSETAAERNGGRTCSTRPLPPPPPPHSARPGPAPSPPLTPPKY